MKTLTVLAFAAAALPLASSMATANDSDVRLFGRDPGESKAYACFARHYDAVHLQTHPKQNVRDVVLLVNSYVDGDSGRQYMLQLGVSFRKLTNTFQTGGGCSSSVDGKQALNCSIDCDGGQIDVSVKDTKTVLLSIPDGAPVYDPNSGDMPLGARFGSDDKLFRLDRTKMSDCLPLAGDDDDKAEMAKLP